MQLQAYLRNPIPLCDCKVSCVVVEQDHANVASVVCIDNPCTDVDKVFVCEARPWRYPTFECSDAVNIERTSAHREKEKALMG